jgi:uncharacterized membrane protein YcjF (UPF0283 family)
MSETTETDAKVLTKPKSATKKKSTRSVKIIEELPEVPIVPEFLKPENLKESILENDDVQKEYKSLMKQVPDLIKKQREELQKHDVGSYSILVGQGCSRAAVALVANAFKKEGWDVVIKQTGAFPVNTLRLYLSIENIVAKVDSNADVDEFVNRHPSFNPL